MTRLFLDTGVLVASVAPRDAHHEAAWRILDRVAAGEWSSVHTSDYVVAESMNFIARKVKSKGAAEALADHVFGSTRGPAVVTSVLRIHSGRFATAAASFRKHFDEGLSFTDWTSLVVMEDERIGQIATFDRGFAGRATVVDGTDGPTRRARK